MKKYLFLLLTLFALVSNADSQNYPLVITAAGGSVVIQWPYATNTIYITTNGVVNLSPTYSLNNADLPPVGQFWYVRFNASKLTVTSPTNVNLFGVYPEKDYPGQPAYVIYYEVMYDSTNSNIYLFHQYVSTTPTIQNVTYVSNFTDTVNLRGPVNFDDPTVTAPSVGSAVVAKDVSGRLQYGCVPWCTTGNSGTNSAVNFWGTTDTANLEVRVNNNNSGKIENTNNFSTAWGYQALGAETAPFTTSLKNTAVGYQSLKAVVNNSQFNTAVGYQSALNQFTGTNNTAIGYQALLTSVSGAGNTAIGRGADVVASNTIYGIAIGYNAVASSNQISFSPNARSLYLPGFTSGLGWELVDTSASGNFIPQKPYLLNQTTYTPVTGDSVTITTSSNLINPAGTIANFTVRLPANPFSGQILEFSFTQTVSTLHWSLALEPGSSITVSVLTAANPGTTIHLQYNTANSEWFNW